MRRGGGHEHDVLTHRYPPVPVDDGQAEERPALGGLAGDPLDLRLGHPGIVLELECGEPAALVATDAGEGDDRAGVDRLPPQRRDLRRDVEILALDADVEGEHRFPDQPPVIGGKSAISRAPAIGASPL